MIKYRLKEGIRILFIGINPHFGSFSRGVPFSNNKNFWYLLNMSGLVNEKRSDLKDDAFLLGLYTNRFSSDYRLGILNVIDRPSRDANDLKKGEEKTGVHRINLAVRKYRPKVVCFVGKVTFQKYSGARETKFGWNGKIYGSRVFVSHFPVRGPNSERVKELRIVKRYAFGA